MKLRVVCKLLSAPVVFHAKKDILTETETVFTQPFLSLVSSCIFGDSSVFSGAAARRRRANGAPYLRKFGNPQITKILVARDCPYDRMILDINVKLTAVKTRNLLTSIR